MSIALLTICVQFNDIRGYLLWVLLKDGLDQKMDLKMDQKMDWKTEWKMEWKGKCNGKWNGNTDSFLVGHTDSLYC